MFVRIFRRVLSNLSSWGSAIFGGIIGSFRKSSADYQHPVMETKEDSATKILSDENDKKLLKSDIKPTETTTTAAPIPAGFGMECSLRDKVGASKADDRNFDWAEEELSSEEIKAAGQIINEVDPMTLYETTTSGFVSDEEDDADDDDDEEEFQDALDLDAVDVESLALEDSNLTRETEGASSCPMHEVDSSKNPIENVDGIQAITKRGGLRPYQVKMAERAMTDNIIACLPTGAGKTAVGLKVMLSYKEQVRAGKKIFFFANTVPLLKQQANVIISCTQYATEMVYSRHKVNWCSQSKWSDVSMRYEVFVIIPAIFKQLLDHGFVTFQDAALFVIDECHNATKADPMSMIMRRYREIQVKDPNYQLPRVLGLTATILKKNLVSSKVESGVKLVERLLCCSAVTYDEEHAEDVLAHSTKATIKYVLHDAQEDVSEEMKPYFDPIHNTEYLLYKALDRIAPKLSLTMADRISEEQRVKDQRETYLSLIRVLADLKAILITIGPFGAMIFSHMKIQNFQTDSLFKTKNLCVYICTILQRIMFQSHREINQAVDSFDEMKIRLRAKSRELLGILSSYKNNLSEFCGIIFVERRSEAHCIGALLDDLKKKFPSEWGFVKAGVVIGTNRNSSDAPKYRQTVRVQNEILSSFRQGDLNVLVATSILQEGIDVQDCSFVIRFDEVKQYPSFIQSMGRARKENAIYYVLRPHNNGQPANLLISNFSDVKARIEETLLQQGKNADLLNDIEIDESDELTEEKIDQLNTERLCPEESPKSPMITLHASIMIVNRYCALLQKSIPESKRKDVGSCRPLTHVGRMSEVEQAEDTENDLYRAYVKMPAYGCVTGVIEGPVRIGTLFAKRAAYLRVCTLLLEAGALDAKLMPQIPKQ